MGTYAGLAQATALGSGTNRNVLAEAPSLNPEARSASVLEFLMVKLLRVYGECLGTKSR